MSCSETLPGPVGGHGDDVGNQTDVVCRAESQEIRRDCSTRALGLVMNIIEHPDNSLTLHRKVLMM